MPPRISFLLVLSLGSMIAGSPFPSTEDGVLKFSEMPNIVEPIVPQNASIPLLNTSAENAFTIQCDGEKYGYNPNIRDCEEAKENLAPDSRIWTLGERNSGLPPDTVPLPYRVMGNRGLCYIQPVLIEGHVTARASIDMIRRAASALVLRCATGTESTGGIATGIGGDNNLAVVLGTYNQPISCRGTLTSWASCREIVYSMPADKAPQVFGPRSDPTVTRGLPVRINSVDAKCTANLFSVGKSDVSSYYDIWQAVTAVFTVCVRSGMTGSATGIGENGNIFVTMTTRDALQLPSNSSEGTSSD